MTAIADAGELRTMKNLALLIALFTTSCSSQDGTRIEYVTETTPCDASAAPADASAPVDATMLPEVSGASAPEAGGWTPPPALGPFPCTLPPAYHNSTTSQLTLDVDGHQFPYDAGACAPLLAVDGDSIAFGVWATPESRGFGNVAWMYLTSGTSGACWSFVNNGASGYITPEVDAYSKLHTDPNFNACRPANIVVVYEFVNDMANGCQLDDGGIRGCTVPQAIAHMTTYIEHRHAAGAKVILPTVMPFGELSEANRALLNSAIRAPGHLGADEIVDFASDPVMGDVSVLSSAWYFDGYHPSTIGHARIAPYLVPVV